MIKTALVTLALVALSGCAAAAPTQDANPSVTRPIQASSRTEPLASATAALMPTPIATTAVASEVPATSPQVKLLKATDMGRPLPPGSYRVAAPFAKPFTLTFKEAWSLESLTPGGVQFHYVEGGGHGGAPYLIIDVVEDVFADICRNAPESPRPPVQHTAAAVVSALSSMMGVKAGKVEDVLVNGRPAKSVQLTNTIPDGTSCPGDGLLWLWTNGSGAKSPGTNALSTERIWAFDVASDVVVVDGETYPNTPSADPEVMKAVPPTIVFD